MNFDRRRSLRLPVDLTVQWHRGWRHVMAKVHDINLQGLFILTDEKVELNHVLELSVALPTGPISFMAVSRFCGLGKWGQGIGAEIHVIAPCDRETWIAYYRKRHEQAMKALPPALAAQLS